MITTSNSSFVEERDAQSITRCSIAHHGDSEELRTRMDPVGIVVLESSITSEGRKEKDKILASTHEPLRAAFCIY